MAIYDLGNYEGLLAEAGAFHGDICGGIRIGTRMTMCGLRHLGIGDPRGADKKKLMVFVEIDRCATDAIMALTGCRPGKRSMKVKDYGKMAATFVNLETNRAVRVVPTDANRRPTADGGEPDLAKMSDEELFRVLDVEVPLPPEDLPGKPVRRAVCARCGEDVLDGREVEAAGETLCHPCFERRDYYRIRA
ncbi:MAG: FmdE family protein [Acidobacteriota bacterium]|jgi:formylmethanofuran dehydrogenase subunit E|nr:FmdE family protein [Acidobacteriota bacterium]